MANKRYHIVARFRPADGFGPEEEFPTKVTAESPLLAHRRVLEHCWAMGYLVSCVHSCREIRKA